MPASEPGGPRLPDPRLPGPRLPDPRARPRRVVVLATGGTIAAARPPGGGALTPGRSADDLLAGVEPPPGVSIDARQILSVDSAAMTPAQMGHVADSVVDAVHGGFDGVVVLHGTDTMEGTALLTDLRLVSRCPQARSAGARVVFTGAQRGADHPEPDGPANLHLALSAAAGGRSLPDVGTVALAFAGSLLPVWGTRKVHTRELDGFAAWPDAAAVRRQRSRALAVLSALSNVNRVRPPDSPAEPPRVDVAAVHPGADAAAFDAFRAAGTRGIVLQSLGAGNANPDVVAAVRGLVAGGIPLVVTTRVPHGPVFAGYGGGGGGADLVAAGAALSPVLRAGQARILLAELLRAGAGPEHVAAAFGG